jgi:hypothetical protein
VEGLPSTAAEDGSDAGGGPHDVDVHFGYGSLVTGLGANPAERAKLGEAGAGLASLYTFTPWGRVSKRADLGDYETAADPDQGQPGVTAPD